MAKPKTKKHPQLTPAVVLRALPNRQCKSFPGQKARVKMADIARTLGLVDANGKVIPAQRPKILKQLNVLIDLGRVVKRGKVTTPGAVIVDGNRGSTTYRRSA